MPNIIEAGMHIVHIIHFREEPIDYGDLDTALRKTCAKMNLKDVEGELILLNRIYFNSAKDPVYYKLYVITRWSRPAMVS